MLFSFNVDKFEWDKFDVCGMLHFAYLLLIALFEVIVAVARHLHVPSVSKRTQLSHVTINHKKYISLTSIAIGEIKRDKQKPF